MANVQQRFEINKLLPLYFRTKLTFQKTIWFETLLKIGEYMDVNYKTKK